MIQFVLFVQNVLLLLLPLESSCVVLCYPHLQQWTLWGLGELSGGPGHWSFSAMTLFCDLGSTVEAQLRPYPGSGGLQPVNDVPDLSPELSRRDVGTSPSPSDSSVGYCLKPLPQ